MVYPHKNRRTPSCLVSCSLIILFAGAVWSDETKEEGAISEDEPTEAGESPGETPTEEPARETILHIDHVFGGQYGPPGILYQLDPQFRKYFFPSIVI